MKGIVLSKSSQVLCESDHVMIMKISKQCLQNEGLFIRFRTLVSIW